MRFRWLAVTLSLVLTAACGTSELAPDAIADLVAEPDGQDGGADTADVATRPGGPQVTILEFVRDDAQSGLATGVWEEPAIEYDSLEVGGNYEHQLNFMMTPFLPPYRKTLPTSGPVLAFTEQFEVVMVSPLDHFFETVMWFENGTFHMGLAGEIDAVPAGFRHRFVVVRAQGIQDAIAAWGWALLEDRDKQRVDRYADAGTGYLGYWTDNGAYYYYKTADDMTEAETLLAVKEEADVLDIPYGHFQLDSWWYFKDGDSGMFPPAGLVLWEPQPAMFPEGLTAFQEALGLPLVLHNRWFALENDYQDDYGFELDGEMALPTEAGVFEQFMANASHWGAVTYEQDWLITQFWGHRALRRDIGRAADWMGWMDDAAEAEGLTMQLCMAGAAHFMDSVDRTSVTTVRTSTDYHMDLSKESYWPMFHTVNMLAWSLGLVPFKDNFQSAEKHGEAECLVSALSAGMVGVGDALGATDAEVVMRTCRADGLLLKPDRPAFPIDAMFLPHQRPYTTATFSDRSDLGRTWYLAAYLLASEHEERSAMDRTWALLSYDERPLEDYFVFPKTVTDWELDLEEELGLVGEVVAYDWRTGSGLVVHDTLTLPAIEHLYDFDYLVLAPIQANGMAFLGEVEKWATVADRRFVSVEVLDNGFALVVNGRPGEVVRVAAWDVEAGFTGPLEITIDDDGTGIGTILR